MKHKLFKNFTITVLLSMLIFSIESCANDSKNSDSNNQPDPQGETSFTDLSFTIPYSGEKDILSKAEEILNAEIDSATIKVLLKGENFSQEQELVLKENEENQEFKLVFEQVPVGLTVTATVEFIVTVKSESHCVATGTSDPFVVTEAENNLSAPIKFIDGKKDKDDDGNKDEDVNKDDKDNKDEDVNKDDKDNKDDDGNKDDDINKDDDVNKDDKDNKDDKVKTSKVTGKIEIDFDIDLLTISHVVKTKYGNKGSIEFTATHDNKDVTQDTSWNIQLKYGDTVLVQSNTNVLTYNEILTEDEYQLIATASLDGKTKFTQSFDFIPEDTFYDEPILPEYSQTKSTEGIKNE